MGVLQCDRKGCKNIMCDRYSPTYGYLCNECFDELVLIGFDVDIKEFMDSEKEEKFELSIDSFDFFDKKFPYMDKL